MPYLVNGDVVPEQLIAQESARLSADPQWQQVPEAERAQRLRRAAELAAIDRTLVAQAAAKDPRPINPELIEKEVQRQKTAAKCRSAFDDRQLRLLVEGSLRFERATREMTAGIQGPTSEEVESLYRSHSTHFRNPELFRAAHIVKHVNEGQSEDQARAGIEAASADLERGEPFAVVAARHSDCKDNGGDLGQFPAGTMVDEFEDALRAIEPGARTGIFRSPFGFHIAELRAHVEAGPASFEDVRSDIERVVIVQREHQAYRRGVEALRSRAEIRFVAEAQAAATA